MKVEQFNVITQSILAFFERIGDNIDEGIPYLYSNQHTEHHDFVGVIGISGALSGVIYIGISHAMLKDSLTTLGEANSSLVLMKDLLNEMMDVVRHYVKDELSADFIISTSIIFEDNVPLQYLPRDKRSYITPFYWREHQLITGICFHHSPKDFLS